MREREYKDEIIFDIENDGNKYELFKELVDYCKNKNNITEVKNYSGFFDYALFSFKLDDLELKLEYSGFMGVELKVGVEINENELIRVRQFANEIYHEIHKDEIS